MHLSELLFHYGEERDRYFQAVTPPIIQSSNFAFPSLEEFRAALAREMDQHVYSRGNNPTVAILRKKLAALEGAEDALVFGSGSAAVAAPLLNHLETGDHVVCVAAPYSWTKALLTDLLARFGVTTTFIDATNTGIIEKAIQSNTKVLFLESPNSLTFELQDLVACAQLAKDHNLISIIDNSYATPLYQRPIDYGIDYSVHAVTKYLNGHSDVMAGVVCGRRKYLEDLFSRVYMAVGAVLSPHDAALVLRGLRTLPLRLERSDQSARLLVERLHQHPQVEQVLYPFHYTFPQYELAQRQMQGAGGLFSVLLRINELSEAEAFFHRLQNFLLAASWGGYESLVLPSAAFYKVPGREDTPITFKLVRFFVGLEDPEWLWADLKQALEAIKAP